MIKNRIRKYAWWLVFAFLPAILMGCTTPSPIESETQTQFGHNGLPLIFLTEEARDIALLDFDYLTVLLLENAPSQVVVERRFGISLEWILEFLRDSIYNMEPIESLHFLLMGEEEPVEEFSTDPVILAGEYLSSLLLWLAFDFESLGHLGPQSLAGYQEMLEIHLALLHQMEIVDGRLMIGEEDHGSASSLPWLKRRADVFSQEAALAFYGLALTDINLYREIDDFGFREEGNVTTEIIEQGRIAYFRIASFMNNRAFDSEILFPFYEEIQDFEHLIIDLRGNGGGTMAYLDYIIPMLIDEPIKASYHEFFMAGELIYREFDDEDFEDEDRAELILAREFLAEQAFSYFNEDDLKALEYVVTWPLNFEPRDDNIPFSGKIWLLVDEYSASLSELMAIIAIDTGFATVVGTPTAGITPAQHVYISLPYTGIVYRIDIGYIVDSKGRSIEEYGIIPDIIIESADALETVLKLIN